MNPLSRNNVTVTGNPAAARTIIFINGLGTDQSCWNQITPAFAGDYRLVCFDNTGSLPSTQPYFLEHQLRHLNIKGYAADLLEICTALELDGARTTLVGHSMGGMAGLLASVERPAQFERIVLIGASPRYANTDGYSGGFSVDDINSVYKAVRLDYTEWSLGLAAAAMGNPDRPMLAARFAESIARIPPELMLTILCSLLQTDQRAELAKVRVPALLVQSQEDFFVPLAVAEYMHANIPGSRLTLIDAKGHLPHISDPDKVVEAIKGFVGGA